MIMCYNFFVGQVYHGLCVHNVVNLYKYRKDCKMVYRKYGMGREKLKYLKEYWDKVYSV